MASDVIFPPDEIHFTPLKTFELSAAHFKAAVIEGGEWTRPKSQGSLLHALTLGGDYAVWHKERRGNAWEAFEKEHLAQNPKKLIVTQKEYDQVARAADAIMKHDLAGPLLRCGEREKSLSWTVMGRKCAGRLDVAGEHVVDLKSTRCAEPGWFRKQAMGMCYHAQLDWYLRGARFNDIPARSAFIVAAEIKPPYAVTVFELEPQDLVEGEKRWRLWMERLLACEAANTWPAYTQSIEPLRVVSSELGLLVDGEAMEVA